MNFKNKPISIQKIIKRKSLTAPQQHSKAFYGYER